MELEILKTDIAIKTMVIKIESSLEDFKEKTPHRKDIIESMTNTLQDLKGIKIMYEFLKKHYQNNDLVQFYQTHEIEKLIDENLKLKINLENITKNLEI
tara:strand:+ start:210 stop:506 length:297 start_codon:yes stop_codon:yes gene_type:complete